MYEVLYICGMDCKLDHSHCYLIQETDTELCLGMLQKVNKCLKVCYLLRLFSSFNICIYGSHSRGDIYLVGI